MDASVAEPSSLSFEFPIFEFRKATRLSEASSWETSRNRGRLRVNVVVLRAPFGAVVRHRPANVARRVCGCERPPNALVEGRALGEERVGKVRSRRERFP